VQTFRKSMKFNISTVRQNVLLVFLLKKTIAIRTSVNPRGFNEEGKKSPLEKNKLVIVFVIAEYLAPIPFLLSLAVS